MHWLRERAHRNRWLADFFERSHRRRRQRYFDAHLRASVGVAVGWRSRDEAIVCARAQLEALLAMAVPPVRKGSPSRVAIRAPDLAVLQAAFAAPSVVIGPEELHAAERMASLDPAEIAGFKLFLATYWLRHESVILSLRAAHSDRVVLHMSCAPRLARAELSIASFPVTAAAGASHLKLVGTGNQCSFDSAANLLAVSAADNYESLPQKVFQGLALITLSSNPQWLLKLDDDHRLKSAGELDRLLRFAAASNEALQLGQVNRTPLPSAHHRAWHFGKCANPELNERILAVPAPMQWAAGSSGYILNRPAMWRILWSSLYYDQWLQGILYEDLALAEVATKTGIRIVNAPLSRAIGAVTDY